MSCCARRTDATERLPRSPRRCEVDRHLPRRRFCVAGDTVAERLAFALVHGIDAFIDADVEEARKSVSGR